MHRFALLALIACSSSAKQPAAPDSGEPPPDGAPVLPPPILQSDFDHALDRAYIRAPQTWLDDAAFDVKLTAMLATPIDFLGGADSAFHADLASRTTALPGGEVICHGDAKFDNFGWTLVAGTGAFVDFDFDDSGACPAAADILHFLVGTDLVFADPALDDAALTAYIDTLAGDANATIVDPATEPVWDDVRTTGVDKATKNGKLDLGGEVQAATQQEADAVAALVAADPRFPTTLVDVARDVHTDGGSAGFRRFWLLVEDAQHPRTVIELKELGPPGTEFGPHSTTYDGPDRFDLLKPFWWDAPAPADHFGVDLLGARFLARDRFLRVTPKPADLTAPAIANFVRVEASTLARKHRAAWTQFDRAAVAAWLRDSATALTARWRAAYSAAGGAP